MKRALVCIFILLSLMSSCLKIPTDEAECELYSTPDLHKTTEDALSTNRFERGDFPNSCWWEMFQDEQLSRLICLALNDNPTMIVAEARVKAALEEVVIKKSRLFPTIGLNASVNTEHLGKNSFFRAFTPQFPANITEYIIDLDFSYEFDFWGKNRNFYRASLGLAKAEIAERAGVELSLSTAVASTYFKWQTQMRQLSILQEERKVITQLFDLSRQRQENAIDNEQDVIFAQETQLVIDRNILLQEEKIALTKHLLNTLLGQGPDAQEELDKICFNDLFPFPLPSEISCDFLARRPDLMAQIWRVEAAAHLVGAAKADFYPNVDLTAFAGLDSVFFNKLFSMGSWTTSVKPALHLPIFTAGRIRANLRARHAEFTQSIYIYNDMLLRAVKEVADKIVSLKYAHQDYEVQKQIVENKMQNQKLSSLRYENALNNLMEVLNAHEEVLREKFLQMKYEYDRYKATIQLIRALGGGYCNSDIPFAGDP